MVVLEGLDRMILSLLLGVLGLVARGLLLVGFRLPERVALLLGVVAGLLRLIRGEDLGLDDGLPDLPPVGRGDLVVVEDRRPDQTLGRRLLVLEVPLEELDGADEQAALNVRETVGHVLEDLEVGVAGPDLEVHVQVEDPRDRLLVTEEGEHTEELPRAARRVPDTLQAVEHRPTELLLEPGLTDRIAVEDEQLGLGALAVGGGGGGGDGLDVAGLVVAHEIS